MTVVDTKRAFQEIVKQYESTGWEVRTIDHNTLRATVRARTQPVGDGTRDLSVQITTESGCRRLWIDSSGEVQETKVPC